MQLYIPGMARATAAVVFEAVKYDGTGDFAVWQVRVKDLLTQQGILAGLKEKKPEKMEDDDREEKQARVAATIRFCLSDEVLRRVMETKTPKEIWDELERQFLPKKQAVVPVSDEGEVEFVEYEGGVESLRITSMHFVGWSRIWNIRV